MRTARATIVLALLAAAIAGCASARPAPPVRPRIALGERTVYVAPIEDPHDLLDAREEALLRGEVAVGVIALTAPKRGFEVAHTRESADFVLEIEVKEFAGPDLLAALVVGFGAGRPGYDVEVRMGLDRARFAETSSRFERAPDGPREAMLRAIRKEAVGFVRRRR